MNMQKQLNWTFDTFLGFLSVAFLLLAVVVVVRKCHEPVATGTSYTPEEEAFLDKLTAEADEEMRCGYGSGKADRL